MWFDIPLDQIEPATRQLLMQGMILRDVKAGRPASRFAGIEQLGIMLTLRHRYPLFGLLVP